jgi:site-specific DNA-methyltransferase (adenine-specific)
MIELLNIDCMKYMKSVPDKYFELAIVDPPYGINAPNMSMGTNLNRNDGWNRKESTAKSIKKGPLNSGSGYFKGKALTSMSCNWDFEKPSPEYFKDLFRVSKNQIIWGGNYFPLPPTRGIICWDKKQPWTNFSQWEMAWSSFDKPAALFSMSNTGGANKERKIHPTQKPVKLYEWLLGKYGKTGDKILDTHFGSGSSAIACSNMGFDLVGCELDKDYYEAAVKRFNNHKMQQTLF